VVRRILFIGIGEKPGLMTRMVRPITCCHTHCLDVAAVGWILLNPQKSLCLRIAAQLGVEQGWLRDFFVFCLALHDMGKFARAFQGLKTDLSPDLVKANPRMQYTERHDTLGFWFWRDNLSTQFEKLFSGNKAWLNKMKPWMEIVTGHHGMPPKKSGGRISNFFEPEDEEATCRFVWNVHTLFLSEFDHAVLLNANLKQRLKTVSWQLAGIAVMADWLGSNQEHFKYYSEPEDLVVYWDKHALPYVPHRRGDEPRYWLRILLSLRCSPQAWG